MAEYEGHEEECYQVLQAVQNDLYKTKSNKPSVEVLIQLSQLVAKINEKRKQQKDAKKIAQAEKVAYPPGGPQRFREVEARAEPPAAMAKPKRIRPYYLKILNEIFSPDCLNEVRLFDNFPIII